MANVPKTTAIIPKNYVRLDGSERRPGPSARLLGPAKNDETMTVTIVLRRRPDGPPVPDHSYYRDTPPAERPRLSSEEFARKYGADQADIDKVTAFVAGHGLKVVETNPGRRTVVVSGTVQQFSKAFGVTLSEYEHQVARTPGSLATETYRGRDGFIHVPAELAAIIVGVFGLDNRRITKRGLADPPATTLQIVPVPQIIPPSSPSKCPEGGPVKNPPKPTGSPARGLFMKYKFQRKHESSAPSVRNTTELYGVSAFPRVAP